MPYKPKTFKPFGASTPAPKRKTEASRLRNTARWQRFRAWYRKRFPLCVDPFGWHREAGRQEAMQQIHHIERLEDRPSGLCDPSNCASLCFRCHGKVNAMERRGAPTSHLFSPPKIEPMTFA